MFEFLNLLCPENHKIMCYIYNDSINIIIKKDVYKTYCKIKT